MTSSSLHSGKISLQPGLLNTAALVGRMATVERQEYVVPTEKLAYYAGLFDGEGCVGIYHQVKCRSSCLRVQVVQNRGPHVVELFSEIADAFGGRVRFQNTRTANIKCCYDAAGDAGCRFLDAIFPYVNFKREQVALGIAWHRQRMPLKRDAHGRMILREEQVVELDYQASELSRYLKKRTLGELNGNLPRLKELSTLLRLPAVLAEHGKSIRILHTLTPLGVAMAGENEEDPYKD